MYVDFGLVEERGARISYGTEGGQHKSHDRSGRQDGLHEDAHE